ncbi:MAG: hypothetical protein IKK43_04355 [Clostridia bacterium]|nr:hypothetical protein [Clostridia bacterium]
MDMTTILIAIILFTLVAFIGILIAFFVLRRKNQSNQSSAIQKVMSQAGKSANSSTAFYQKVYLTMATMPIIRRYVYKIRRRLELLDNDDEYTVREHTGKIALKGTIFTFLAAIGLAYITREDLFMMLVSLTGVLVVVENLTDMMVNKIEDKLLKQQLELFSEVRHAFHETNMVEEAIYEASLLEDYEVTFQADRIYEIMISAEPEIELEKYYDVAPNRFLKAFAGVSYLTKEFGDRKVGEISLYLKNMNNITQELQLEIMKRDKIDYLFQSLSYIVLAPILFIIPLKNWAIGSFESTRDFYEGKWGFTFQIIILIMIFLCYALLKKVKENNDRIKIDLQKDSPWQERIYRTPIIEQFIDNLMPNSSKREYVKLRNLIKETGSNKKIEWLYVDKIVYGIIGFFATLILAFQLHNIAVGEVLTGATKEEAIFGSISEEDMQSANALTAYDTKLINNLLEDNELVRAVREDSKAVAVSKIAYEVRRLSLLPKADEQMVADANKIKDELTRLNAPATPKKSHIQTAILNSHINFSRDDYVITLSDMIIDKMNDTIDRTLKIEHIIEAVIEINNIPLTEQQIQNNAERIYDKLVILSNEYLKWVEVVLAFLMGYIMYNMPVIILRFQRKMRAMEMEDEVMQFQTIILMLMYIERVSVEYIIEWLERFAHIFKEPLSTCLNNYESGAWQALEQLKEDAPYKPFVRIVESLQSAVENVKLTDAFDELETERNFFQEKRKEANERLIKRKAAIGKVIGFAPMVVLFVGYLIVPLVFVSIADMMTYFTQMGSML